MVGAVHAPCEKVLSVRAPRRPVLAALVVAASLSITGCASSTASGSVLDAVKIEGSDPAAAPTVAISKKPLKATASVSKVLKEGDGAAVTKDDMASVNALIVNGTSGNTVDSTWDTKTPVGIDLSHEALFPALRTQLPGKKVGSRVLIVAPPKDVFGTEGNSAAGLKGTDTVVMVLDILGATKPLAEAKGEAVAPVEGQPTVEYKGPKEPSVVTMPAGAAAPTSLIVQPLIAGTGAELTQGQTVRVNYTGVLWKDGSVFDSSSTRDPGYFEFQLGGGNVISAWDNGLKGQKVGSRVMLIVPPADGYGATGSPPKIAGDDTLVFVVDILAAY
ncbi:Peptidyl-prolyl cis-trans isomerase [Phycicoccus elongatus Lp2]|uniref:peptidylprolyl isomerase n=1 Tax=Phycicoccus elongatus Lp2 TaxID=1193181 RepID=N0E3R2_9MICO|nr:Peptidyl-prolyl cis-trans isomerase [Phycicoccus elongatus Lp2]